MAGDVRELVLPHPIVFFGIELFDEGLAVLSLKCGNQ